MSDYIKREDILARFTPPVGITIPFLNVDVASIISLINSIPAADVAPVKHGKWMPIIEGNEYGDVYQCGCYCSECGETLQSEPNYCPNCGAKMRCDDE